MKLFFYPKQLKNTYFFIQTYSFENYSCQINGILSVMISLKSKNLSHHLNVLVDSIGETALTCFFFVLFA